MPASLSEIDSLYKDTISKLTKENRIEYCEHLIDNIQLKFMRNKNLMSAQLKEQLIEIIEAASNELLAIEKENHK